MSGTVTGSTNLKVGPTVSNQEGNSKPGEDRVVQAKVQAVQKSSQSFGHECGGQIGTGLDFSRPLPRLTPISWPSSDIGSAEKGGAKT